MLRSTSIFQYNYARKNGVGLVGLGRMGLIIFPCVNTRASFRDGPGAPGQRSLSLQPNRFHCQLFSRGGESKQYQHTSQRFCTKSWGCVFGGIEGFTGRVLVQCELTRQPWSGSWVRCPQEVPSDLICSWRVTAKPCPSLPLLTPAFNPKNNLSSNLSFFTKFNKLCKKLLKGFLKMQEDYYAHTTAFIGMLTALPPNASDAGLHWSLSSAFPTDRVHPRVPRAHSPPQTVSPHQQL